jgi:ketosteroid isomerase-like protein
MRHAALEGAPGATDHAILEELNHRYVRSVEERDTAWFDSHLAPDFMNGNPDGTLVDRAAFLKQIAAGAGVSSLRAHDVLIRLSGDLAIIHARTSYTTPAGKSGGGRYIDVWTRRDGRWLCVAAQVARC